MGGGGVFWYEEGGALLGFSKFKWLKYGIDFDYIWMRYKQHLLRVLHREKESWDSRSLILQEIFPFLDPGSKQGKLKQMLKAGVKRR